MTETDRALAVRSIAVELFKLKSLDDTDKLVEDIGAESTATLEFVYEIEERCNVSISDEAVETIVTIADAVRVAEEAPAHRW